MPSAEQEGVLVLVRMLVGACAVTAGSCFLLQEAEVLLLNKYNGPQEQAGCGHDRAPRLGAAVCDHLWPSMPVNKAF